MSSFKYIVSFAFVFAASQAAPASASATSPSDRMICKQIQRTGTRFRSTSCATKANWDKLAEEAKRAAASFNRSGRPIGETDKLGYTYGK